MRILAEMLANDASGLAPDRRAIVWHIRAISQIRGN